MIDVLSVAASVLLVVCIWALIRSADRQREK
jgi:hypothetical protein